MPERMIRRVRADELEQCADVVRKSFQTVACEFGLTAENAPTNGAFTQTDRLVSDRDKGAAQFGLFEDSALVGFMELLLKGETALLEKLCVLPDFRHGGRGATLLRFAGEQAAGWGCRKIAIGIIENNRQLRHWYELHGFVHTGTKDFAHLPFTVGFMELVL